MKKLVLLLCLVSFWSGRSQESQTTSFKKNELKLNAVMLIAGAGEFTYERILDEESSAGISLFFSYDKNIDTKFSLTPYYRFFFGKKPAAGFFVEGFGMYNTYEYKFSTYNSYTGYYYPNTDTISDFALGFGLGSKWITKKGFVFEINAGVGRNLFNPKSSDYNNELVGRGGITLGYRF